MQTKPVIASFFAGILITLTVVAFSKSHKSEGDYVIEHEKDIARGNRAAIMVAA